MDKEAYCNGMETSYGERGGGGKIDDTGIQVPLKGTRKK